MHEIENWIEEAVQQVRIQIRKLPKHEAILVQQEVISRYVAKNSPCTWWWNFKRPVDEHYDRNLFSFLSIAPAKNGSCWLMPDTEAEWLPVYEIDIIEIEKLTNECPGFEYYVAAHDFTWLIVETHHDQYYVCREFDKLPQFVD